MFLPFLEVVFMSFAQSLERILVPIHREGYPFIAISGAATLILGWFWSPLFWIGLIFTGWICVFFRDPQRVTPVKDGIVVSPADGKVCAIGSAVPPSELNMGDAPLMRVGIFMNIFDCHVNRAPISGQVERVAYKAGAFVNAELDKASEDNERNGIIIKSENGSVAAVQIAGLVARRIVCFVKEGENISVGDRFGLIRFGSRVDVYMPQGTKPVVAMGQTMVAGETILADLKQKEEGDTVARVS